MSPSGSPEVVHPPGRRGARVTSLDGLRGLAASSVLVTHAIGALAKTPEQSIALFQSPLSILANGGGGVNLFFVLSGYCLAAPAARAMSRLGISQYYLRRILRIHIPFVAALLLTWFASLHLYPDGEPTAGMSAYVAQVRNITLTFEQLGRALLFPGSASGLIPVGWTLRVEMIYSLLLPLMIWLVARSHWSVLFAISLAVLFLDFKTLPVKHYAIDFSIGIAIYCEGDRLAKFFSGLRGWRVNLLLLAGWVVMALPSLLLIAGRHQRVSILLYGLGSMILVSGAVHDAGFKRFLSGSAIAWIGRVSYSIYLIHYPIIILLSGLVHERVGILGGILFCVTCLLATYLAAALLFRVAEKPSIELGYAGSEKLARIFARAGRRPGD